MMRKFLKSYSILLDKVLVLNRANNYDVLCCIFKLYLSNFRQTIIKTFKDFESS